MFILQRNAQIMDAPILYIICSTGNLLSFFFSQTTLSHHLRIIQCTSKTFFWQTNFAFHVFNLLVFFFICLMLSILKLILCLSMLINLKLKIFMTNFKTDYIYSMYDSKFTKYWCPRSKMTGHKVLPHLCVCPCMCMPILVGGFWNNLPHLFTFMRWCVTCKKQRPTKL